MESYNVDNPPIERKKIEVQVNGLRKKIPAIDKYWLQEDKREFCRYACHPLQNSGKFIMGAKETWLELVRFYQDDLKWLLSLSHHKFWSYMVHSKEARQLLTSFLQEAPPFYLQDQFPNDKEMKDALSETERLVFLVFLRLSVKRESKDSYTEHLGEILYNNYLFTVPILLDICLIYGNTNRELVSKLLNNVISAAPQFLNDFKEIIPHLRHTFKILESKFQVDSKEVMPVKIFERRELHSSDVRDLILHFYDSIATVQIFLEIYPSACQLFINNEFMSELASFYANVIPKMYVKAKSKERESRTWKLTEMVVNGRVDVLKIVKHILSFIINEAMNDAKRRQEYVEEYLLIISELLSENLFIADYHNLYPIDLDVDVLSQIYPNVDTMKINYILEAVTSCLELAPLKKGNMEENNVEEENACAAPVKKVSGVELESLITEVKDILPHLGDGFINSCLKYYNYDTEKVIAAILENTLPPNLEESNWDLEKNSNVQIPERLNVFDNDEFDIMTQDHVDTSRVHKGKRKDKYKNANELLEDKTDIYLLKDRYQQLAIVEDVTYDDEYDDTYESVDVSVREADEERRPFVVPRVLRGKEESEESEDGDDEEEVVASQNRDCFVQNPAEWREKQEQRRMDKAKRDLVGKPKGHGQDKSVLVNRDFKGTHKSFTANHNRRKQASRKRNQGMIPS